MFSGFTLDALLDQAREVSDLLQAWLQDWETRIWHELWAQSPVWFRVVMVLAAAISVYESVQWVLRQLGITRPSKRRGRRSR